MAPTMPPDIDPAIVDSAIAWSIRLQFNAAHAREFAAFEQWRSARPEHDEAWRRIQAVGARFDGVAPPIAVRTLGRERGVKPGKRKSLKTLALVFGGGTALWFGSRSAPWQRALADYATAAGAQRTLRLADGTTLVLNTDTALNVRFDSRRRLIDLVRGEIYVSTGPDAGAAAYRPFLVQTRYGRLRALGTRFFVRLGSAGARLSVTQGAVEISPRAGERAVGHAGEVYLFNAEQATQIATHDPDAGSWLDGVLLAREMPLGRFLAELARYRAGVITCDASVARLPVSGAFQTRDTDKTLKLVAASLHLALVYRTRFWVEVTAAG